MFFEEARELLLSLEEGLMELERRKDDRAHLDRTFRAAHSIKGAAAMVGLGALAEFTHGIEAVLDHIRAGTLAVDSDLISTLLDARDHLAAAVEAEAAHSPIPAPTEMIRRLATLLRDPTILPEPPPAPPKIVPAPPPPAKGGRAKKTDGEGKSKARSSRDKKPPVTAVPAPGAMPHDGGVGSYRITLKPGPEILRRGVNPLGVLDELRELGPTRVSTDPDLVPPLEEMDPERCYLVWTIEVETDATPDRLDDVFLFVAEDSNVTIERRTAGGIPLPPPPTVEPAPPPMVIASKPMPIPVPVHAPPAAQPAKVNGTAPTVPPPAMAPPKPAFPAAQAMPNLPRMTTRIRVDAGQLDDLVGVFARLRG